MSDPSNFCRTLQSMARHVRETKDQLVVKDNPLTRSFTYFAIREGTIVREWDIGLSDVRVAPSDPNLNSEGKAAAQVMVQVMRTPEGRAGVAMDLTRIGQGETTVPSSEVLSRFARILREDE